MISATTLQQSLRDFFARAYVCVCMDRLCMCMILSPPSFARRRSVRHGACMHACA